MMGTQKEQLVAMLDEAKVDYAHSDGDSILVGHARFQFFIDGKLRNVWAEDIDAEDY